MTHAPTPDREAVLDVAEHLLAAEGPGGLSVRRIADQLGVSRQIVYSRFGGKPDLVRALHQRGFGRLVAAFEAVAEPPGTRAHVLAMSHAYRATALAQPALFELMFGTPIVGFTPDAAAREVARASFQPVVDAAHAWLAHAGRDVDRAATYRLATAVWAATHGVVALEVAGVLGQPAPPLLEELVSALLDR